MTLPDPSSPPPTSAPQEASSELPRNRSVQFSIVTDQMSRSVSPTNRSQLPQQAESSADEATPIVGKEKGHAKNRSYEAVGGPSVDNGVGSSRQSRQRSSSSAIRRKSASKATTSNAGDGTEGETKEKGGWWKDLAEKCGSVELDNKGSTARDHLALERTFLAWLRTSLAFASIGIAVTQLFRLNTTISEREGLKPLPGQDSKAHLRQLGKPLGATFLGIAIMVLLVGGRRYFESQYWIVRGKFPASRGSVFLVTFVALALIITSLIVVCVVDPGLFEKK